MIFSFNYTNKVTIFGCIFKLNKYYGSERNFSNNGETGTL